MEILKTAGMIAGIGGVALGVLLLVFREIIQKKIFPTLTKAQSTKLLYLISILTWSVAVLGILCWTYVATHTPPTNGENGDNHVAEDGNEGNDDNEDESPSYTPAMWEKCGDEVIDRMIDQRNALIAKAPLTEAQAVDLLRPLFSRPAFVYLAREGDWNYALFAVCKTRLVMQELQPVFKSSPTIRQHIETANTLLLQLEREIEGIYNPGFKVTKHIDDYIHDKDQFLANLPAITKEPDATFNNEREATVMQIRETLAKAGLSD